MATGLRLILVMSMGIVAFSASPCFAQKSLGICWTTVRTNGHPGTTTAPFPVEPIDHDAAFWQRHEAAASKLASMPLACGSVTDAQSVYQNFVKYGFATVDYNPQLNGAKAKGAAPASTANATPATRQKALPGACLVMNKPGWAHNACDRKMNVTYCNLTGATMNCREQSFGMITIAPYGDTGTAAKGAVLSVLCPYPSAARKPRYDSGTIKYEGCQ